VPSAQQAIDSKRYSVIPRTVIFLRQRESYLLIKGAPGKERWPGTYNGVGGHLERGEDVLTAAARELKEETGLEARLWLCGTVVVDAGETGVALYVFSGQVSGGALRDSAEGAAEWFPYNKVSTLALVDDAQVLLARINKMRRGEPPFAARSYYDDQGKLHIRFAG
jgi:8-oxo-dGTP diphosphatase